MNEQKLRMLLEKVANGGQSIDEALQSLKHWPAENMEFARLDHHRMVRTGLPEVVFSPQKTGPQLLEILKRMTVTGGVVMATRVTEEQAELVCRELPLMAHHPQARMLIANPETVDQGRGVVVILTAGTSDIPVAEEAAHTVQFLGNRVERLYDVGVAGIHRLYSQRELLAAATVLIVIAGMEGALPSVVGGRAP